MIQRAKKEWCILKEYMSVLIFMTVLFVLGGILLWVHGSAAPWVFRNTRLPSFAPGFTISFFLWIILYALSGMLTGVTLLSPMLEKGKNWYVPLLGILGYIFLLAWYPLFFSVLHTGLALVVLAAAVGIHVTLLVQWHRYSGITWLLSVGQILLEGYLVFCTFMYILLN